MAYLDLLTQIHLMPWQWGIIAFGTLLTGLGKGGIRGMAAIRIVAFALVFEEKASMGILLPILVCADFLGVVYYRKYVKWHHIKKLMPAIVVGVLVGVWEGHYASAFVFNLVLITIIFASVFIMAYSESKKLPSLPNTSWISNASGFFIGFTSMVGNIMGPIINVYFFALRLPKKVFIGTTTWLFFIVNVVKLPFHFFIWKTITLQTLALDSVLIPILILGFFLGARIVKLISNTNYRRFILITTTLGGIILLLR